MRCRVVVRAELSHRICRTILNVCSYMQTLCERMSCYVKANFGIYENGLDFFGASVAVVRGMQLFLR